MTSLRARLFLGLSALVIATNAGFGVLALRRASEEASEFQDATLRQVGFLATANRLVSPPRPPRDDDEADAQVVIEEFGPSAGPGSFAAGMPPSTRDGLSTVTRDGRTWRVLLESRADGTRVAVGQSTAARDEIVRDTVFNTIVPLLMVVPCLLVLVGLVIHLGFRPLSRLASRLDGQTTDDLAPLPSSDLPNELIPFIDAINRLLVRVTETSDQRRRFVADAAHELRTPLTALTVQVDNLLPFASSGEGVARLEALQGGMRRVGHLVEQLLSLARYDSGGTASAIIVALDVIAKEVVAGFVKDAGARSIDLGFDRIERAWVWADPTALAAIVRNLVDNALRHSPDGGRVDVDVFRQFGRTTLRVSDTGLGIPDAELDRVFDPFVRGRDTTTEGTGLGLAIVRSVVSASGGTVVLANRTVGEGGGLVATVTLPTAEPKPSPAHP